MKLYKLFNDVIIEESIKNIRLLTEGVNMNDVRSAIDNKQMINITYRPEEDNVPTKRYVGVYNLGKTKSGNDAIRVYEVNSQGSRPSQNWKTYRLDRIEGWQPANKKWYNPASDYDSSIAKYQINRDKTFSSLTKSVDPTKFNNPRNIPNNRIPTDDKSDNKQDRSNMVQIPTPEPDDDFIPEPTNVKTSTQEPGNNSQPERKVQVPTSNNVRRVKTTTQPEKEVPEKEPEIDDNENNNEIKN